MCLPHGETLLLINAHPPPANKQDHMANSGIALYTFELVFHHFQGPRPRVFPIALVKRKKKKSKNSVHLFWQFKHGTICGHPVRTSHSGGLGSSKWGCEVPWGGHY